jgi:hypothetical protein
MSDSFDSFDPAREKFKAAVTPDELAAAFDDDVCERKHRFLTPATS